MPSRLSTHELSPFGVEVDIDLSKPIDDETIAELKALYDRHYLVVFRNQSLSHEAQIEFISQFGPLLSTQGDGVGYISNKAGAGSLGDGPLAFHSDLAFSPEPFLGISLHAVDVEEEKSSTRYISAVDGYRRLNDAQKRRLEGLHALHVFAVDMTGANTEDIPDGLPRHVHPLVMKHPRTGDLILYAALNQIARIVELPADESRALIDELFAHQYDDQLVYEHRWRKGDLVLWDNLALQHGRGDIAKAGTRTLQRVVLARKGFFEQHPEFSSEQFATMAT